MTSIETAAKTAQHTPGPWVRCADPEGWVIETSVGGRLIASVEHDRDTDEGRANAALVAAAPDLLAACKRQLAALAGSPFDVAGMAAAHRLLEWAVARAEGRA